MELFSFSFELTRLVFLFGAIFAMFYKKKTGITPGGIVVPAFLAILIDQNFVAFMIAILVSLLCRLIYKYALGSFAFPRKWMVFINISIATVLTIISRMLLAKNLPYTEISALGFVMPGLIASNSAIYGDKEVLKGTFLVTAVTYVSGYLLALLIPFKLATKLTVQMAEFAPMVISHQYVVMIFSLITAGIIMYRLGARAGGYLLAPVTAFLLSKSILQFLAFLAAIIINYYLIKLILKHSLIIGLERFVLCILMSLIMVTSIDLLAVTMNMNTYYTSPISYVVAMAVILNDLSLQNLKKPETISGLSLPVFFSFVLRLGLK